MLENFRLCRFLFPLCFRTIELAFLRLLGFGLRVQGIGLKQKADLTCTVKNRSPKGAVLSHGSVLREKKTVQGLGMLSSRKSKFELLWMLGSVTSIYLRNM